MSHLDVSFKNVPLQDQNVTLPQPPPPQYKKTLETLYEQIYVQSQQVKLGGRFSVNITMYICFI